MRYVSFVFIIPFLILIGTAPAFPQDLKSQMDQLTNRLNVYTENNRQISVYLKAAKNIYICGEDLWFHAYVLDAQLLTLSNLDRTLYLQLQQKDSDTAVWQEMYPIVDGISRGHVYLPQTLPEGDYLLKAYTAHSFLGGLAYFYAVEPLKLFHEPNTIRKYNTQPDTLAKPRGRLQFTVFPEGGNLAADVENRVAFKAVKADGNPEDVAGTLLKGDQPVLNFKTMHAGMGSFTFKPEKGAKYLIRLEHNDSLYAVPEAQDNGIVLHFEKRENDSLTFKIIASHPAGKRRVFLRLQMRGMVQYMASGVLGDSLGIRLPTGNMPQGIAEATLFDERLQPLAERLVYLNPDKKLTITFSPFKEAYGKKEKVTVKVRTTGPDGKPVQALLSMSVYDSLFSYAGYAKDILNYYHLTTQLRGRVYDPAFYFDTRNPDRADALDLLLLTQGWRRYAWNEELIAGQIKEERPVLSDSIQAWLVSRHKRTNVENEKPVSLMMFNYNKSVMQVGTADKAGTFYLRPEHLAIGSRVFVKYVSEKEYRINTASPFDTIKQAETVLHPVYLFAEKSPEKKRPVADTGFLQYGKTLAGVTITGKGTGFGDKYLGYLDSIAKFEGVMDFVGGCGWLNCPACGSGTKPVEGHKYYELIEPKRSEVTKHPFYFIVENRREVVYHYPKYTEEELLKKFKMGVIKGYYQSRQFYEPDYDKEPAFAADARNTLFWKPDIVTDRNGEATISFFSSDIRGHFTGLVEGVGEDVLLGTNRFGFSVR